MTSVGTAENWSYVLRDGSKSILAPFDSWSTFTFPAPLFFSNNVFPILDAPVAEDEETGVLPYPFSNWFCGDAGTADGTFSWLGLRVGSTCANGEL
jgi:hypothetical protein